MKPGCAGTLAIQFNALGGAALDACRLAFEAGSTVAQALRQRASAASLTRAMTGVMRPLAAQRMAPPVPERDWGGTAAALTAAWQAAPARPAEAARGAAAAAAEPETVVKWIDEIDDAELAIAVEQDRREKAGEPPLPTKGPKVLYRYKPEDYIRRFKPDERAKRPYPGWENMTMAEGREFFGYTYDGPVGPPEALTPASRDAMLAEMAAEAAAAATKAE